MVSGGNTVTTSWQVNACRLRPQGQHHHHTTFDRMARLRYLDQFRRKTYALKIFRKILVRGWISQFAVSSCADGVGLEVTVPVTPTRDSSIVPVTWER